MHEKNIDTYNLHIKNQMVFSIYKNDVCIIGTS